MKIKTNILFVAAVSAVFTLVSCASAPASQEQHDKITLDWQNKNYHQVEMPAWVFQLGEGNDRPFKDAFGIEYSRVCRRGEGSSIDLEQAKALSRLNAAEKIADEFRAMIEASEAFSSLNGEQKETAKSVMKSTKVQVSGLREEESHWILYRTWDWNTNKYYNEYVAFTAFSMSRDSWDSMARAYLNAVMSADGLSEESRSVIDSEYSVLQEKVRTE